MAKVWNYGKPSVGSKVFDFCNAAFMVILMVLTIYPILYVIFASFSDPVLFLGQTGLLFYPLGFQIDVYKMVLTNTALQRGYLITLFVVTVGTSLNMISSLVFAYVLSRKDMMLNKIITFIAIFTMYFSGGLIPTYLVVRAVGLVDNVWSLIFPVLINTYYVIILRTAFEAIPKEMEESAKLDGAGTMRIFVQILLPLIVPSIAAISLFFMVDHWNSWTNALIYLRDSKKFPLQLILRSILLQGETQSTAQQSGALGRESSYGYALRQLIKYATVVITMVPILCVYPFLQKYFTKGVMIGAVKG
jgi:putative aldouronate transport system permease protein